ncbi:MAG: Lrp/AsnC family transcriptional regulator [Syntrophaceticus schinkii]
MFSKKEEAVLKALQNNLPLESKPFDAIAQQIGLEEEEVISIINSFLKKGVIRRVGASLGHRTGFCCQCHDHVGCA